LRNQSGDVAAIEVLGFDVEVNESNGAPGLLAPANLANPMVVASGAVAEISLQGIDSDLPIQTLRARIVRGPEGGQLVGNADSLQPGDRLTYRWLASEGLGERTELVEIAITDSLGGETISSFTIRVPAVPPSLALILPEAGIVNDERVTVSGSVSDNSGNVTVKLMRDGVYVSDIPVAGGLFTYRLPDRLTQPSTLVTVVATDGAGNQTALDRRLEWAPLRRPILGTLNAVNDGQEVVVPIGIETPGDVSGMALSINYDPTYLKSPQVTFTDALPGSVKLANVDKPGEIVITLSSASGRTLQGGVADLAEISFRARSVPETTRTSIRARIEDTSDSRGRAHVFGNGNAISELEIRRRALIADNNGNNLIDVGDAYLIQRKLVRLDPMEVWDVLQNDLNASGSIDSGDVTSVLRIVVDLDPPQPLILAGATGNTGRGGLKAGLVQNAGRWMDSARLESKARGFLIRSGPTQARSRAGTITLQHPSNWLITRESVRIMGGRTSADLLSVASHAKQGFTATRISYLLMEEVSSEGLEIEVQPVEGLGFGGEVGLIAWTYTLDGFELRDAVTAPGFITFPGVPSQVESIGVSIETSSIILTHRGMPGIVYSLQVSEDLRSWRELTRHRADGEFRRFDVGHADVDRRFYRGIRVTTAEEASQK
jgi:hypothetical protein